MPSRETVATSASALSQIGSVASFFRFAAEIKATKRRSLIALSVFILPGIYKVAIKYQ